MLFDRFGGGLADQHAVIAADVIDDGFVEFVAADAHTAFVNHATQRNHTDFGGAAADVNHHGATGVTDRQTGTDGRGHGFFNQIHL